MFSRDSCEAEVSECENELGCIVQLMNKNRKRLENDFAAENRNFIVSNREG